MPESLPRKITGSYRRQVSDGNYGTELAEVTFEWWTDAEDSANDDMAIASDMLANAHDVVMDRLRKSLSASVRRSVAAPRTITPPRAAPTTPSGDEEDLPF
jgi:hypothetical protein